MKKDRTHIVNIFNGFLEKDINEISRIYLHLFSLMPVEDLKYQLEYLYDLSEGKDNYFKEEGKEHWFAIFHKSIRQTDFFDNCFQKVPLLDFSEEDFKEFKFLLSKVKEKGYDKTGKDGEMFNPEYHRYLQLSGIKRNQKEEVSIDGNLDNILYNTIHIDTKQILVFAFKRTFAEYKIQNEK